ncbi:hypothetical protein Bca52824_022582 [Brassica carinata]|uniref:Uncharacterized protein n=1 Tax=Brassica carinata TaxID=52824 RepID=A0A8X7VHD0_BRACI|nr:hypothetical protein Bca52824_022582 [Brassica carinata]
MVGKSLEGISSEIAAGSRSRSTEALPPADAQRFPGLSMVLSFSELHSRHRRIPPGLSTATFVDDPACKPLTILTITISFAITRRNAALLGEVEDTQVTSLLQKLLSGETFGVEDFPAETPPYA